MPTLKQNKYIQLNIIEKQAKNLQKKESAIVELK